MVFGCCSICRMVCALVVNITDVELKINLCWKKLIRRKWWSVVVLKGRKDCAGDEWMGGFSSTDGWF